MKRDTSRRRHYKKKDTKRDKLLLRIEERLSERQRRKELLNTTIFRRVYSILISWQPTNCKRRKIWIDMEVCQRTRTSSESKQNEV